MMGLWTLWREDPFLLLLELIRIPMNFLGMTEAYYFEDHGVKVDNCKQAWYDFEKRHPLTGIMTGYSPQELGDV